MRAKFINESVEESQFSPEQKKTIEEFISDYNGEFEDEDLHDFAESLGLDVHEVEEYVYNMARENDDTPSANSNTKKGFNSDIEAETIENDKFRKVLYTGKNLQLVLMSIPPGGDIGMESHDADQFFRIDGGEGKCIINGNEYDIKDGSGIVVPGGAEHNVINTSDTEDLKLYTIYGPPNHVDGIEADTKEEGEGLEKAGKDKFEGETTE